MTMSIEKLTSCQVVRISTPGKCGDGGGLYLQVTKTLVKSWVFRFSLDGLEHYMGLGSLDLVCLKEARKKAHRARAMLAKGIDPLRARRIQNTQDKVSLSSDKTFGLPE
jgi:hypothetical protein